MKCLVAAGLVLATSATALAAPFASTSWSGRAFVRSDASDRVVVVLDADRNGSADHLFLFDPLEPLLQGIAPRETDVVAELDATGLRVTSRDGRLDLTLRAQNPPAGTSGVAQSGSVVRAYGRALVHRVLGEDAGAIGTIDTDPIPTVYPSGRGPSDDPCLNPTYCRSGGKGSSACEVNCEGRMGSMFGVGFGYTNSGCSVACNLTAGYYSCCNCEVSGGTCGCYSSAPCLLDPKRPVTPGPE